MSSLKCPTTKTILGEWEDVYSVVPVTSETFAGMPPGFYKGLKTYYQTFGGGPEGGYIAKMNQGASADTVYRVSRGWFQPWKVEEMKNVVLEYEPENVAAGQPARCRKVEAYSLRETRAVIDEHLLDGNADEIVKALRDGLSSPHIGYKNTCLSIILTHFAELDKYLDLLRPGSTYKDVLETLAKEQDDEDEERESDSE